MAAKGTIVKEEIVKKLLEIFPTSFVNDKEVRIDMVENGNPVQIKITLTAVKIPISNSPKNEVINKESFVMTEDEKTELEDMLEEMGVQF